MEQVEIASSRSSREHWRGRPLIDYRTIVELIGATTSSAGLTVRCQLDENLYPAGIKVTDREMAELNILRSDFPRRMELHNHAKTTGNEAVNYRQFLSSGRALRTSNISSSSSSHIT